jgi:hypothetical protein
LFFGCLDGWAVRLQFAPDSYHFTPRLLCEPFRRVFTRILDKIMDIPYYTACLYRTAPISPIQISLISGNCSHTANQRPNLSSLIYYGDIISLWTGGLFSHARKSVETCWCTVAQAARRDRGYRTSRSTLTKLVEKFATAELSALISGSTFLG